MSSTSDETRPVVEYDPRTALMKHEGQWHEVHFPGTAGYSNATAAYRAAVDDVLARMGKWAVQCDQVARFGHLF